MGYDVRLLTDTDAAASWELGRIAFGSARQPPQNWGSPDPSRIAWGAFDGAGRLVAKAVDRQQAHWFGGRLVPASGVAGVAVTPELRGPRPMRHVLTPLLANAGTAVV